MQKPVHVPDSWIYDENRQSWHHPSLPTEDRPTLNELDKHFTERMRRTERIHRMDEERMLQGYLCPNPEARIKELVAQRIQITEKFGNIKMLIPPDPNGNDDADIFYMQQKINDEINLCKRKISLRDTIDDYGLNNQEPKPPLHIEQATVPATAEGAGKAKKTRKEIKIENAVERCMVKGFSKDNLCEYDSMKIGVAIQSYRRKKSPQEKTLPNKYRDKIEKRIDYKNIEEIRRILTEDRNGTERGWVAVKRGYLDSKKQTIRLSD